MKPLFASILIIFSAKIISAQNSGNGYWSPIHGEIRVLLVFAEETDAANYNDDCTEWLKGQMPLNPGKYFDAIYNSISQSGYMTKYISQASFKSFKLTGDYVPSLIQVTTTGISNITTALNSLPGADLTTQTGLSVNNGDFDKWKDYVNGSYCTAKNSGTNARIDLMVIVMRTDDAISSDNSGFFMPMLVVALMPRASAVVASPDQQL